MTEPTTSLLNVDRDSWVSIGRYLHISALAALSITCRTLHDNINHNDSLWSLKLRQDYQNFAATGSVARPWHAAYVAANGASYQCCTKRPWCVSLPRPSRCPAPSTSELVITRPQKASITWGPSTFAVSLDHHMMWWRPQHSRKCISQVEQVTQGLEQKLYLDCDWEAATSTSTTAAAAAQDPECAGVCYASDPQYGHTAFVDALIQVPAAVGIGYASGSRDKTIKLWTPFVSSSSSGSSSCSSSSSSSSRRSPVRLVRPLRTLRGHTGSITALQAIADSEPRHSSGSSRSSSNSGVLDTATGGVWNAAAVLASASADKTIKLWSLSALQSSNSSSGSSSSNDAGRNSSRSTSCKGSTARLQAGRSPLLATLRGHSDCVTDLLLCNTSSNSNVGTGKLISSSRDSRIKLWDISSQSCVTTWKMPGPCVKLLHGTLEVSNDSVITVLCNNSLMVLDPRVAGGSSDARSPCVLSVHWPAGGVLRCAAAFGSMLAAGGRKGVRVWDVRSPPATSSAGETVFSVDSYLKTGGQQQQQQSPRQCRANAFSSSSSSSSSSRVLFTGQLPNNAPVTHVHLDRQRVLAASSSVKLHCEGCIAVWSVPEGHRVQLLSSTLAPIHAQDVVQDDLADELQDDVLNEELGAPPAGAAAAPGLAEQDFEPSYQQHTAAVSAQEVRELLQMLSATEAAEAFQIIQQHYQWQQQPAGAQHNAAQNILQQQQQMLQQQFGDDAVPADQDLDAAVDQDASDASSSGSSWEFSTHDHSSRAEKLRSFGVIEPGVIAMSAAGPVLASVNSIGQVLLRDFSRGSLPPDVFQQISSSNNDGSIARSIASAAAASSAAAEAHTKCQMTLRKQTGPEMDATAQVLSKFWAR